MPTTLSHNDKLKMVANMRHYGGGFVVALAECFIRADDTNLAKLLAAFPEYVNTYLFWGQGESTPSPDFGWPE